MRCASHSWLCKDNNENLHFRGVYFLFQLNSSQYYLYITHNYNLYKVRHPLPLHTRFELGKIYLIFKQKNGTEHEENRERDSGYIHTAAENDLHPDKLHFTLNR